MARNMLFVLGVPVTICSLYPLLACALLASMYFPQRGLLGMWQPLFRTEYEKLSEGRPKRKKKEEKKTFKNCKVF